MTKGRNSTVIGIRVPDEMYFWLARQAFVNEITIAEYIKCELAKIQNKKKVT